MFAETLVRMSGGIAARGLGFVSALAGGALLGRRKARFAIVQLVVGLMVAVAAQAAFAAGTTYTWTGSSDGTTWETTGNWSPSGPATWNSTTLTAAYFNTPSVTAALNVSDSTALLAFGANSAGDTIAANPGGALVLGASGVNASSLASGTVTISSSVSMPGAPTWVGPTSAGTLVIAGPESTNGAWILNSGNFEVVSGGTMNNTGSYIMFNKTANPSNILQTGGLIQSARSANHAFYLSQGVSVTNYNISGGSAIVTANNSDIAVAYGSSTGTVAIGISGNAFVKTPRLEPEANNSAGNGTVNMQGGLLLTDQVFDQQANSGGFSFSGGTIEPIDGGTVASSGFSSLTGDFIGHSTNLYNFNMPISGNGATIDTTDASGNPQNVYLYANTSGNGSLTAIGAGTLILAGTNTGNYSGQININSGTVKVAANTSNVAGVHHRQRERERGHA